MCYTEPRALQNGFCPGCGHFANTICIFVSSFYNEVNLYEHSGDRLRPGGRVLIRDLERIGHDISLIERDPEQLKRLDAFDDYRFGGTALVGDPTTRTCCVGAAWRTATPWPP